MIEFIGQHKKVSICVGRFLSWSAHGDNLL